MLESISGNRRHAEFDFSIDERSPEKVVTRMPVVDGAKNPFGLVQAGAMIWIADVSATILVLENTELGPDGQGFPLAIDIHTSLVGNQRDGEIFAEAVLVKKGRRVSVVRTRVTGTDGKLLAEVTTTHVPA